MARDSYETIMLSRSLLDALPPADRLEAVALMASLLSTMVVEDVKRPAEDGQDDVARLRMVVEMLAGEVVYLCELLRALANTVKEINDGRA